MSEKTRQRLSTFESPTAVMKLISLPKQLIERAEARRKAGQPARLSGTLFARLAHGIDSPHIPDV